jgi:hypothetical protein
MCFGTMSLAAQKIDQLVEVRSRFGAPLSEHPLNQPLTWLSL